VSKIVRGLAERRERIPVRLQETAAFEVVLLLSTEEGELPTDEEVTRLIRDQMDGVLDETTGLNCIHVAPAIRRSAEEG